MKAFFLFLSILLTFVSLSAFSQEKESIAEQKKKQKKDKLKKLTIEQGKLKGNIIEEDTIRYQRLPSDTITTYKKGSTVLLESGADFLESQTKKGKEGKEYAKVVGKRVVFKQGKTTLICDSAYRYKDLNVIEAFGDVEIIDDTVNIKAQQVSYDGNSKIARARTNVRLQDSKMTLTTNALDYSVNSKIGYYFGGGNIVDSKNNISSLSGTYVTQAKYFFFKDKVNVVSNQQNDTHTITSDTLQYSEITKDVFFKGKAKITSRQGVIRTNNGTYNTITQISQFFSRSEIENAEYILKGDRLFYDDKKAEGSANGNAEVFVKKDNAYINGAFGRFWGEKGLSRVWGNASMRQINGDDTLFTYADTIVSFNKKMRPKNNLNTSNTQKNDKTSKEKPNEDEKNFIQAYKNVRMFRKDFQAKADSLVYQFKDSSIRFYKDPILWSGKMQTSADSIQVLTRQNKPYKMQLRYQSFIISQDTLQNFNQIKGRNIDIFLDDSTRLKRMEVDGNSETIFFMLDADTAVAAMYKVLSSNMLAVFANNKLKDINFYRNVDGDLIPPHELQEPDKRLVGFHWRQDERPTRKNIATKKISQNKKNTDTPKEIPENKNPNSTNTPNNKKTVSKQSDKKPVLAD